MTKPKESSTKKMRKRSKIDMRNKSSSHTVNIKGSLNWFGDTRLMPQTEYQSLIKKYTDNIDDPYKVVVVPKTLPRGILKEPERNTKVKRSLLLPKVPGSLKGPSVLRALGISSLSDISKKTPLRSEESHGLSEAGVSEKANKEKINFSDIDNINKFTRIGRSDRIRGEVLKLIDSSDVLLVVLDARDPMGTRIPSYESLIKEKHKTKKLIFVVNKADLVPQNVLKDWMKVLSQEGPTIAFSSGHSRYSFTKDFGVSAILAILKQIKGLLATKGRDWMSVGVMGYPNVGKSSLINALRKKKVCSAAPKAGETKENRYIMLENNIYIIDSPGIVCPKPSENKSDLVLKGVCRHETVEQASQYIHIIVDRIGREFLNSYYGLEEEEWESAEDFIELLGKKRNRLMKGGVVDVETVSKNVIADWNRGKLPWYKEVEKIE